MSEKKTCSFCNRGEGEVEFLIPSPDLSAYICPMCIELCSQIIDEYDFNTKEELLKIWKDWPEVHDQIKSFFSARKKELGIQ